MPVTASATDGSTTSRIDDLGEECLVLVAEGGQHLGAEVVRDRRILAGHHHGRAAGIGGPGTGQRGQVDARRPTFGPFAEHADLVGRERTPRRVGESLRLVHVEGEFGRADLEEVPASAEPGEIQVRLGAPRKGDLEAVRQVVDERDEGIEARPIDEPVCVVEDEDGRLADPVDSSRKARHRRRQEARRRGADCPSDLRIDRGEAVKRRGEVGEEDARLVVVVVDREPVTGRRSRDAQSARRIVFP